MKSTWWVAGLAAACLTLSAAGSAEGAKPYPVMAPLRAYLIGNRAEEIALARSAAPPSVSAAAEVLVLGPQGYVSAAPGKNGFVCMVQRAWFSGVEDPGFWNPKLRAPVCYNAQGARSVLPMFLTRTRWVLAGASQAEIRARTRAAMAAKRIPTPEIGTISYMMSKKGYLGDDAGGPWHPHLMFYMPPMPTADWGANLAGSQVQATKAGLDPYTMFYIPVSEWSDGTPDASAAGHHRM